MVVVLVLVVVCPFDHTTRLAKGGGHALDGAAVDGEPTFAKGCLDGVKKGTGCL